MNGLAKWSAIAAIVVAIPLSAAWYSSVGEVFVEHWQLVGANSKWISLTEYKVLDALKERVEQFCAEVSGEHPECPFLINEIVVTTGNPVEEILKLAEKKESDLLVMGAHGHGILTGAMIGSISRRVLRRCKKPVLVIRLPGEKKD